MKVYTVEAGYNWEGVCGLWVFTDEVPARAKFEAVAAAIRKEENWEQGDYVSLRGPFAVGENTAVRAAKIAYCNPKFEASEAADKARAAARLAARRAATAGA